MTFHFDGKNVSLKHFFWLFSLDTETTTLMKSVLNISKFMSSQHEAIVFFSYLMAFVWFVLSMRPNDYLRR